MHFVHTSIIIFILTFSFFNQSLLQKQNVKVIEDDIYDKLLEIYRELKRLSQLNSWRPFLLMEVYFFQWRALLLVETIPFLEETIPFSGNYCFQWKLFLLVEAISFSGSHSFHWKPFHLREVVSFGESRSFYSKLILFVEAIPFGLNISCSENMTVMESILFSGSCSFQLKLRFSGNHYF